MLKITPFNERAAAIKEHNERQTQVAVAKAAGRKFNTAPITREGSLVKLREAR